MADLKKSIRGNVHKDDGKALLVMDETAARSYFAFALLERRTEREIFPESLLDDWGHEIKSLALYGWIQENGLHFPRAELFGYDREGSSIQCFLRDLDLMTKYPCYVFGERKQALSEGIRVVAIGMPDPTLTQPERVKKLTEIEIPMSNANVFWWRIDPKCSHETIQAVIEESSYKERR